jgi:hypothetical protein
LSRINEGLSRPTFVGALDDLDARVLPPPTVDQRMGHLDLIGGLIDRRSQHPGGSVRDGPLNRVDDVQRHVHPRCLIESNVKGVPGLRSHVDADHHRSASNGVVRVNDDKWRASVTAENASQVTRAAQCLAFASDDDQSGALRQGAEYGSDIAGNQLGPHNDWREFSADEFDDLAQQAPSGSRLARGGVDTTAART